MAAWAAWGQAVVLAEFAAHRPGAMSGTKAAREATVHDADVAKADVILAAAGQVKNPDAA